MGSASANMSVEQVLEWVAAQFPEQKVAQAVGPDAKMNALRDLLASRSDLLIGLDEIRDAAVAQAILETTAQCTVILNGPRRLDLAGLAQEFPLTPLNPAEAEQLFVQPGHAV